MIAEVNGGAGHPARRGDSHLLVLPDFNVRHCIRKKHTVLDNSARASRQERLLQIKRELSDMLKRCA